MEIDNIDPIEMVRRLREYVKGNVSSVDASNLPEAKARYRIVTEIIDRFIILNIPIPDDVRFEKVNLEKMLSASYENKVRLKELAGAISSLMKEIRCQLLDKQKVSKDNIDQRSILKKGPRKKLHVTLPNGEIICEPNAVDTFVKVIQLIGLKQVAALQSIRTQEHPLVSTMRNNNARNLHEVEGHYIETHSSTELKAKFIKLIANELNLNISVDLLD
jgi:hypothetical protein